ncbi:INO80 complex, subunit Ies4 [Podospora didyma]|uniref:INO80 complex, subunit Ies4 n=1 Tax=Podospora didyma TaxID=330526 RepID=A0AAE0K544_9PEZI|nr:INO80 complex, subunit Ies4 [Podospora didyma]
MPPYGKHTAVPKDRRKSATTTAAAITSAAPATTKITLVITLKITPKKLRAIVDPESVKEDTPVPEVKESPATSTTIPAAPNSNTENASDSTPNTPAAGTPAPQPAAMGPPADGPKKKGPKRGAAALNGEQKVRGKPGPKKKQKLEDGTMEGGRGGGLAAHKLGPKANQGAINAGLRALDRSGKPCRKWAKGGFTLKSFTGVVWEIPRWTAPAKSRPESSVDESTPASAEGSSKENKEDNSQAKSDVSNNGVDIEMQSTPPSVAAANSPAPFPIAAA